MFCNVLQAVNYLVVAIVIFYIPEGLRGNLAFTHNPDRDPLWIERG